MRLLEKEGIVKVPPHEKVRDVRTLESFIEESDENE